MTLTQNNLSTFPMYKSQRKTLENLKPEIPRKSLECVLKNYYLYIMLILEEKSQYF